jgi:N-terminal domain of (some) glycogen debranching enzymes
MHADPEGTGAWASGAGPPVAAADSGTVTLVEGSTFCLSSSTGDIVPDRAQGLFVADTRVVSTWRLRVDGTNVEPLTVVEGDGFRAAFVGRTPPRHGHADSTLLVQRHRFVGEGMREDLVLRNVSGEAVGVSVSMAVAADFADLFEVKESRPLLRTDVHEDIGPRTLGYTPDGRRRHAIRADHRHR